MELSVENLLGHLKGGQSVALVEAYGPTAYGDLWDDDPAGPRLYRAFSRALIDQGHPVQGLKLARRGLEIPRYARDAVLQYHVALAYARGGNISSAEEELKPILEVTCRPDVDPPPGVSPKVRVDVVALRGRLYKDRFRRETDPANRSAFAGEAVRWYLAAAALPGADAFPLVNAATMSCLGGNKEQARELARQVLDRCGPGRKDREDYWLLASIGEACVVLGDYDRAVGSYVAAAEAALKQKDVGSLVSMLGNLRLLAEAGATADPRWVQEKLGSLVVFSGHRIDPPFRLAKGMPPRFPNNLLLIERVQEAIRTQLEKLNARFGFCSLASGCDILFAEEMLRRENAELHVVLPFARDDFLDNSVDYGLTDPAMARWRQRFEGVLGNLKPGHLHYATEEPLLGAQVLFDYGNTFLQGLAVVRARQCHLEPTALVVIDPDAEPTPGGTRSFVDAWRRLSLVAEPINLAQLREDLVMPRPPSVTLPPPCPEPELPRVIRAMLFADVANFSKMKEEFAPRFFAHFSRAIAEVLQSAGARVLLANTWGDGFFAVFLQAADAASFALEMIDRIGGAVDWKEIGFPDANPLRVGLHAGPVFEMADDPVLRRPNFFGQHVNRTARIEPVTMPGCAFASEQFAALLTIEAPSDYRCELIGMEKLAKDAGVSTLYRINRC